MNRVRIHTLPLLIGVLLAALLPPGLHHPSHAAPLHQAPIETGVTAAAATATITLQPVADTYIQSTAPTANFATLPQLVVARNRITAVTDTTTLLRFDFGVLPPGAIINGAQLRLRQTTNDNAPWDVVVNRLLAGWQAPTVTWNTRPPGTLAATWTLPATVANSSVPVDVTDLVRTWVYGLTPNFGLEIEGAGTTTRSRSFSSVEAGVGSPELVIDYTPPPTAIQINEDTATVVIDGRCDLNREYAGASTLTFVDVGGQLSTAYLKHDAQNIYVCVIGAPGRFASRSYGLYLDTDYGREKYATEDDYALRASIVAGVTESLQGTGNPNAIYTRAIIDGWKAATTAEANADTAEYMVDRGLFARGCTTPFGLALYHHDVRDNGEHYGLPAGRSFDFPDTWLTATLENPRCIRVCSVTAEPCTPAIGATVQEHDSGATFALDSDGYVLQNVSITNGQQLWAILPISATSTARFYHTSGDPQMVEDAAFQRNPPGVMTLVVGPQHPLLVRDLTVTAQWNLTGDGAYQAALAANLQKASAYFYDFTNGQMAVGTVTVRQNYEDWPASDMWLYAHNSLRPGASPGGLIDTPTVDPEHPDLVYQPGHFYMGSHWNRYGFPPGQPLPAAIDPTDDWAKVMAHELGHFWLFHFDTYLKLGENNIVEQMYTCTGSAMGWVYDEINTEFVADAQHWQDDCSASIAGTTLERTEWQTMKLWYPWMITPTQTISGPEVLPAGLTAVSFITPTGAAPTLVNQLFALDYRAGETATSAARAILVRDDRIIDQGQPAPGTTQMTLLGAAENDRFCVFDLNFQPKAPETLRHQYGCEFLEAGDNTLYLEKDATWQPTILVDPVLSTTLAITVSQPISGGELKARLYPEHESGSTEITLTPDGDRFVGLFTLPKSAPAAYVEVYVDETAEETDPRRAALIDYGVGGGSLPGPRSKVGHAPVVTSSDGQAFLVLPSDIVLAEGEFVAIQRMVGVGDLALDTPVSQAYRVIAYPKTLAGRGSINLSLGSIVPIAAASMTAEAETAVGVYFQDGNTWRRLDTQLVTAPNGEQLASAPSQGAGTYILLDETNLAPNSLYFPVIRR
jgi:hypothetical protein